MPNETLNNVSVMVNVNEGEFSGSGDFPSQFVDTTVYVKISNINTTKPYKFTTTKPVIINGTTKMTTPKAPPTKPSSNITQLTTTLNPTISTTLASTVTNSTTTSSTSTTSLTSSSSIANKTVTNKG